MRTSGCCSRACNHVGYLYRDESVCRLVRATACWWSGAGTLSNQVAPQFASTAAKSRHRQVASSVAKFDAQDDNQMQAGVRWVRCPSSPVTLSLLSAGVLCQEHGPSFEHDSQLRGLQLPVSYAAQLSETRRRSKRAQHTCHRLCVPAVTAVSPLLCMSGCRFSFGKTPMPQAQDPAFQTPCFNQCPTKKVAAAFCPKVQPLDA